MTIYFYPLKNWNDLKAKRQFNYWITIFRVRIKNIKVELNAALSFVTYKIVNERVYFEVNLSNNTPKAVFKIQVSAIDFNG